MNTVPKTHARPKEDASDARLSHAKRQPTSRLPSGRELFFLSTCLTPRAMNAGSVHKRYDLFPQLIRNPPCRYQSREQSGTQFNHWPSILAREQARRSHLYGNTPRVARNPGRTKVDISLCLPKKKMVTRKVSRRKFPGPRDHQSCCEFNAT